MKTITVKAKTDYFLKRRTLSDAIFFFIKNEKENDVKVEVKTLEDKFIKYKKFNKKDLIDLFGFDFTKNPRQLHKSKKYNKNFYLRAFEKLNV